MAKGRNSNRNEKKGPATRNSNNEDRGHANDARSASDGDVGARSGDKKEPNNDNDAVKPSFPVSTFLKDSIDQLTQKKGRSDTKLSKDAQTWYNSMLSASQREVIDQGIQAILFSGSIMAAKRSFDTVVLQARESKRDAASPSGSNADAFKANAVLGLEPKDISKSLNMAGAGNENGSIASAGSANRKNHQLQQHRQRQTHRNSQDYGPHPNFKPMHYGRGQYSHGGRHPDFTPRFREDYSRYGDYDHAPPTASHRHPSGSGGGPPPPDRDRYVNGPRSFNEHFDQHTGRSGDWRNDRRGGSDRFYGERYDNRHEEPYESRYDGDYPQRRDSRSRSRSSRRRRAYPEDDHNYRRGRSYRRRSRSMSSYDSVSTSDSSSSSSDYSSSDDSRDRRRRRRRRRSRSYSRRRRDLSDSPDGPRARSRRRSSSGYGESRDRRRHHRTPSRSHSRSRHSPRRRSKSPHHRRSRYGERPRSDPAKDDHDPLLQASDRPPIDELPVPPGRLSRHGHRHAERDDKARRYVDSDTDRLSPSRDHRRRHHRSRSRSRGRERRSRSYSRERHHSRDRQRRRSLENGGYVQSHGDRRKRNDNDSMPAGERDTLDKKARISRHNRRGSEASASGHDKDDSSQKSAHSPSRKTGNKRDGHDYRHKKSDKRQRRDSSPSPTRDPNSPGRKNKNSNSNQSKRRHHQHDRSGANDTGKRQHQARHRQQHQHSNKQQTSQLQNPSGSRPNTAAPASDSGTSNQAASQNKPAGK